MSTQTEQVVVVSGASAGVGRAVARRFGARGAKVALLARGSAGLEGAAADVEAAGGTALPIECDVSDAAAVDAAADRIESELGPIDVWINVAFVGIFAPFWKVSAADYEQVTAVTYLGYVNGTRAALVRMRDRDRGAIVQVGSALAYRGIPLQSAYCGAKHAMQGLTESVRCELMHEKSNVHITMVQLPAVNTPQFSWVRNRMGRHAQPVPPIYQPEVPARTIEWAADHPNRREYQVGITTALTIAADKIASGLLDRYLGRTGFDSQQTDELPKPRVENLYDPADDDVDHGAHGEFDDRSHGRSLQALLSRRHDLLGGLALAAGASSLAAGVTKRGRARSRS